MLSVAHWGHEAKHKLLKKMLHIGDNVAHWGVVASFILPIENQKIMLKDTNRVGGIGRLEIATSSR